MGRSFVVGAVLVGVLAGPAAAQQIYKCSDGRGGNVYQQTQCAGQGQTQEVRRFRKEPARPAQTYQPAEVSPSALHYRERPAPVAVTSMGDPVLAATGPTGYVRCHRPDGRSYVRAGNSCPERREPVQHQAGMVLDVTTGRQHFMVPGGGNGMIDPRTGQRHELISPPPTRTVRDTAQPVSAFDACSEAGAIRDRALRDPNRTINTIRAAEARYARMCGR